MRILVWQDHGEIRVISGSFEKIKKETIRVLKFYYHQDQIDYIEESKNEELFQSRVKSLTEDDEMYEVFEFVNVEEI